MSSHGLSSAGGPSGRVIKILSLLPVAVAVMFAVALAFNIRSITTALAWSADLVSPMVLAESLGRAHGPNEVVFGTYAPLTTLLFNVVTRHLPAHRTLWMLAPLVFTTLGIAALGWAVWRVAGRWAALVTVAVAFCGSPPVLSTLLAQANHGPAYVLVCILAAFLVFIATRPASSFVVAAAAALGIVAGLNLASDPLLLLVGMAPFLGAAVLVFLRQRPPGLRHLVPLTTGVTGLSLLVAVVTTRAIKAAGYGVLGAAGQGNPLTLATPSQMWTNLHQLVDNLLEVFNADFRGALGLTTPARVLLAGLAFVGLCVPVVLLARSLATRESYSSVSPGEGSARALLEVYWGLVVIGLGAGLLFSRLAVQKALISIAYCTPLFLAVVVTVPMVARGSLRRRAVVGVGGALFCGFSVVSVAQGAIPENYDHLTYVRDGDEVLRVLEEQGLRRGYASYGAAAPLTFRSGGRIFVAPVITCVPAPDRLTLCGFPANRVKGWYTPKDGRSFVIADPIQPWPVLAPPPAELGVPSQVLPVGSQTVFVYPYDVASRFGPTG